MTSSDEDDAPSLRAQLSKERSALANKVKRTSTRSESLLKNAKPLRSPVNGRSQPESNVTDFSVVDVRLGNPPSFRNGLTKKSSKEDVKASNGLAKKSSREDLKSSNGLTKKSSKEDLKSSNGLTKKSSKEDLKSSNGLTKKSSKDDLKSSSGLTKKSSKEDLKSKAALVKRTSKEEFRSAASLSRKSSRDEVRYEEHMVKKDSIVLPQPLSHGSSPQKSAAKRFPLAAHSSPGTEVRNSPYVGSSLSISGDEKLKSLAGYRVAQAFAPTSNESATPSRGSSSPTKSSRKATVMLPSQPSFDSTVFSPPKPQRKAPVISGAGVQVIAQVATEDQRRNAGLKVAQFFGDPRLVASTPKTFATSNGTDDALAKAKADRQYAQDREDARQARAMAILSAHPSADQLALPDAQRSRPTPLKAVAVMGDSRLEREMIQNVSSLPFDPSNPVNGKPARVLGSVHTLAQPKVGKVLGKSSDEEDAKVRAMARESDLSGSSTSTSTRMVANLRRRLSGGGGGGSISSSRSVPELRGGTPQRRMLMRMYSSNMTDDPSANVSSNLDRDIKQRQELETRSELATLLNRFSDVVISKS